MRERERDKEREREVKRSQPFRDVRFTLKHIGRTRLRFGDEKTFATHTRARESLTNEISTRRFSRVSFEIPTSDSSNGLPLRVGRRSRPRVRRRHAQLAPDTESPHSGLRTGGGSRNESLPERRAYTHARLSRARAVSSSPQSERGFFFARRERDAGTRHAPSAAFGSPARANATATASNA